MKLSKMPRPEAFYICRTIDGALYTFDKRCNRFEVNERKSGLVFFIYNTVETEPPMSFDMAAIPLEKIAIIERKEKGESLNG